MPNKVEGLRQSSEVKETTNVLYKRTILKETLLYGNLSTVGHCERDRIWKRKKGWLLMTITLMIFKLRSKGQVLTASGLLHLGTDTLLAFS